MSAEPPTNSRPLRWAVLGTANIAAGAFLPAMRGAGDLATVVGSRDPGRAAEWAGTNQVARAARYDDALEADDVDAIYIAVPNDVHVDWAKRAVATGRPVLCEKPLGLDLAEVNDLLTSAGDALLWEAFVFPFHPQTELITSLCGEDGPVGPVREIVSEFHFRVTRAENIRWDPARGGGALMDVGCYPIRLARLLFQAEPITAAARAFTAPSGVDGEFAAVMDFPDDRRLVFSAGMRRAPSTFTRIIGADAELRVSNPFHPREDDTVELWRAGERADSWPADPVRAFEHAVRHIDAVVRSGADPRHLAVTDSRGNAAALDLARSAAGA